MSLLVFLNELSYQDTNARHEEIIGSIHGLVALLREVRRHRTDIALVTEVAFVDLTIGTGFSMRQWQADGRNRDSARFIRAMRNRAPFSSVLDDQAHDTTEYTHDGRTAHGLGWAHLGGGLAASLALSPAWNSSRLLLHRCALVENDAGDVVLEDTDEEVRHASQVAHVAEHRQWIYQTGVSDIHTGAELWRLREDVFPRLRFLPRVAEDLERLHREWVRPAKELLSRLQEAAEAWDPGQAPAPTWPTKVTPEHEQRRRLCWFDDPVAGRALFDLHARLTPGAGRLHFRWDADKGEVIIGYLGRKLE
ncbi:MAG TPA: hypothetical protein VFM55_07105 [Micromonosporaceae bacterium]|nr:hypothetical protein [Micromonosporaceae bacterium]